MKFRLFYCLIAISVIIVGNCFAQSAPDSTEKITVLSKVSVTWKVETNFLDDGARYRALLTFKNNGDEPLPNAGWTFYFNYLGVIDKETVPSEVDISLINGDFYKLEPTDHFNGISPGEEFTIPFEAPGSKIKEGDAPAGLYFVDHASEETISISNAKVLPFTDEEQLKRGPGDNMSIPNAEWRFKKNASLTHMPVDKIGQIIPTPTSIKQGTGTFKLAKSIGIGYQPELKKEAQFLSNELSKVFNGEVKTIEGISSKNDIALLLDSDVQQSEAYELSITSEQITISGADKSGIFYGIQSLRGLLPPKTYQTPVSLIELDAQTIKDEPRFSYRGLHLDVARNFQSAATVKKLLDVMAFYKLNTFHFHLTDDEGWRLPVESLPELTEIGGRRGHTTEEQEHIIPSYGSGPNPEKSPGSGSYDRETFVELLRYAAERHIEVMPEIDVPGHARAAIVAMKSRYEQYKSEDKIGKANRYRLHEPEDSSQYRSVQNWDDNVINVCQASTYRFMETVIDEIIDMYAEAGAPLSTIHMGGDEVPHGAWEKSPACNDLIENDDDLDNVDDLPDYFFERIRKLLAERGLTMAGWEEIALDEGDDGSKPDPEFAGKVQPYVWANIWGSGTEDHAYKLANNGYEVVMSQASNFYFDLAYNNHPQEPGLYWAGFVRSQYPYEFIPFDLYKNAEQNVMGNPIPDDAFEDATKLTEEGRENILGLQGQLWSEKLISADRMEYMVMPRLFGLAERAWAQQPDWATIVDHNHRKKAMSKDWNEFANRLGQRELLRMDYFHNGMKYRLPPPGAVIESDTLKANSAFPGLTIRYTLDGSKPSVDSNEYTDPVVLEGDPVIKIRTFSSDGRGGRTVIINK
ncbi:family 20 glycosylhydrolase [Fodinibius sp. Rm-B-1B1-1]|uniref:family 20 glycosylhydrolase n=1 Tax=Fodinibius alkaliphilus TaxID=3140241 RepID=UPI00315A0F0E